MRASSLSFFIAVITLAVGMAWGLAMAMSQNHSTMPAHAHLNLLGWVSLFLFGMFYRLHPALDFSRLAKIQVFVWTVGTVVLTIGVALFHAGHSGGEPFAAIGSIVVFADLFLFGWLLFKHERAVTA